MPPKPITRPKRKQIGGWLSRIKVAAAVGRVVLTGKHGKTFDKVERGTEIADQALAIFDLIRKK